MPYRFIFKNGLDQEIGSLSKSDAADQISLASGDVKRADEVVVGDYICMPFGGVRAVHGVEVT